MRVGHMHMFWGRTHARVNAWVANQQKGKKRPYAINQWWLGEQRRRKGFLCLFSSPFLPPSVPLLLSNSVCQLGVHSKTLSEYAMRITRLEAVGFLELCVPVCVYVCMCVCVCVSLVCGTKMSQCVPRQTFGCVTLAIEDYKPSLCLLTLAHSAPVPLANDPVRHIHSFKQTSDLGSSLIYPPDKTFAHPQMITRKSKTHICGFLSAFFHIACSTLCTLKSLSC